MKYLTIFLLCIISSAMVHTALCEEAPVPHLYETLFFIDAKENSPARIDVGSYPTNVQSRLVEYQTRAAHFRSRMKRPKGPWEQQMAFEKQIGVEHGIVALIATNGIEKIAAKFAQDLPLYYEWEGFSGCPLDEAKYVEEYLSQNPKSPLKPYLLLFLLQRYRSAYECLASEEDSDNQAKASIKYRHYLMAAKGEGDRLVRLIAENLDNQPFLYMKTENRP